MANAVAASVNGVDITVKQINDYLTKKTVYVPDKQQFVLDKLISYELMRQHFSKVNQSFKDIEENPEEAFRRHIKQSLEASYVPSNEEVASFYHNNPALFSERMSYGVQQYIIKNNQQYNLDYVAKLRTVKTFAELEKWLLTENVKFEKKAVKKAAENWPMDFLNKIHKMSIGEVNIIGFDNTLVIFQVVDKSKAPILVEQARLLITQYLINRKVEDNLFELREKLYSDGNIEYFAPFEASN